MHEQGTGTIANDFRVTPTAPDQSGRSDKGPQVSKSDQQLFGPLAGIVRQLGVAASAVTDARTLMRARSDEVAGLVKCAADRDQVETGEQTRTLLTMLWELEDHAMRLHRHVAEDAIREYRNISGSAGSPIATVPELNWGTLAAALKPHPLRDTGLTVAVASDLQERICEIWRSMDQARAGDLAKGLETSEALQLGQWTWTLDEELPLGRWDIRAR